MAEDPFPGYDAARDSDASTTRPGSVGELLDGTAYRHKHRRRRRSAVAEPGQNAISTLLQPPTSRAGLLPPSQKPPTSRYIPPVTLTTGVDVESSIFNDYLSQVGALFNTFQRTKLESEDDGAQVFRQDISAAKDEELARRGGRKNRVSKRGQLVPAPLSTIPAVYFDENFRLENPRTFDIVSERAEVMKQPLSAIEDCNKSANGSATDLNPQPARKALTTNAILQEKLSWYMDTIEIQLVFSISKASASFFAALGSLRRLQAEVADSVAKIQKLREGLAHFSKEMVVRGFEIISMKRRRDNLRMLGEATKQLQCVLGGASHCKKLVDSGQLETAKQHISYVEQLACGTLDPKIGCKLHWLLPGPFIQLTDLRRLHALGGLSQDINQLRLRIWKSYEAQLLDVLLCDLRRHVSGVPPRDTLARWADTANRGRGATDASLSTPAFMTAVEKLREELIPVLQGLGQSQYLTAASAAFREAVIREMKSLIRRHLPSSTDDDDESVASESTRTSGRRLTQQEKSSILSRNMRALSPEDAEAFFVEVYCGIGEALRRLHVQIKVLLDITSGMTNTRSNVLTPIQTPKSMGNPAVHSPSLSIGCNLPEMTQTLDMSSLLVQAVDKAQSEMAKVLHVRAEQTVRLGLADFLSFFTLNRLFVNECEAVSGHSGAALKGIVNNQMYDFIPLLHEVEKQKLLQKLESEKWERVDFKPKDALILAHFVQPMTADPPAWLRYMDVNTAGQEIGEQSLKTNLASATEPTSAAKQNKNGPTLAVIEEEQFRLVDSTAFALRGIEQYAILLVSTHGMANEISTALLDYLKLYNSRIQQLILGAGARITAGLTNINTKHLALASQSLSFFIALIPYLRGCASRRPSITASSMAEYDRLKCLFQDHRSAIDDKLIDIMNSRANLYIREMEKIRWDDEDELQRNATPHIEMLTKEVLTLQRVLSKYLPALSVRSIFRRVFVSYREQWGNAFEGAAVQTEAGKARLLRDAELLETKLANIDGAEDFGMRIINIVTAKQIASQTKANRNAPSG
ncbi:uncharacterized protein GIQ15_03675 [Arthroderma uncinatum]|uniref:uncharacterized protein n=1 Tax=Arthroderma uncinatum TaxID=74035 RepID=UPI00144AA2D2|nr:uncharacterized protein GIQ15_03675 [Arthroderma uncinatum]KAF3484351.1 hypothetical protein GIQ15_03675 [Arthroderma uncinatum]